MSFRIVERTFVREVDCSAAVVWWNHWDHEHVTVAHEAGWVGGGLLYEDEKYAIAIVTIRVPVFSFLTSQALNINIRHDDETMYTIHLGLFGIPSVTRIRIHEDRPDHVVAYAKRNDLPFVVALDPLGKALEAFGPIPGTPTRFVVARDGTIAATLVGAGAERLRARLAKELARPQPTG